MKPLLTILTLFVCLNGIGQVPDSVSMFKIDSIGSISMMEMSYTTLRLADDSGDVVYERTADTVICENPMAAIKVLFKLMKMKDEQLKEANDKFEAIRSLVQYLQSGGLFIYKNEGQVYIEPSKNL